MIRKTTFIIFLSVISILSFSQHYTISGFVKDSSSRELMIAVNIYIPELKTGTTSNNYGFYSISLPAGKYQVTYSFIGYKSAVRNIDLDKDFQIDIDMSQFLELNIVEISAEKNKKISETPEMSSIEIPVAQVKKIPALLGEKDVLKVIQLLPGVQTGTEGTSGFYVRGGAMDQNLIILDDATVYNAFHLFGFFSLFNGDAIKSIELIKGGFPARYGGRLSSVIEMNMKDGNKTQNSGEASIGIISSNFVVEGPLIKDKSSFLISGRRTYFDLLTLPFMSKDEKVGYYFYDFNAKINYEFNKNNKLYLSGYFGRDKFYDKDNETDYIENAGIFWGNQTATLRWNHLFNQKLFANTSLIFSNYKLQIYDDVNDNGDVDNLKYFSGITDFSLKCDFEYHPWFNHILRAGFMSTEHVFRPSALVLKSSYQPDINQINKIYALESGIYVEDEFTFFEKAKMNAGVRLSNFIEKDINYTNPEPRISFSYILAKDLALKASYARMNQYIHLLSNTGLGLPTDLWIPSAKGIPAENSQQVALGLAKDIGKDNLTVSIEGYYKKSNNVIDYKEGASFLLISDPTNAQDINWADNVTSGQCWSYGTEFLVQRKIGKLSGWIGYTLSWTQLQFDDINFGKKYYAGYDRRHDISVVLVYEPDKKVTLSATWVFGTGNAISLPESYYSPPVYPNWNFQFTPDYVADYGAKNSFRMAPYNRLDFGAQFHKKLKWHNAERTWEISIYNFYNRHNPYFYYLAYDDQSQKYVLEQVSLFPFIPSLSYSIKF